MSVDIPSVKYPLTINKLSNVKIVLANIANPAQKWNMYIVPNVEIDDKIHVDFKFENIKISDLTSSTLTAKFLYTNLKDPFTANNYSLTSSNLDKDGDLNIYYKSTLESPILDLASYFSSMEFVLGDENNELANGKATCNISNLILMYNENMFKPNISETSIINVPLANFKNQTPSKVSNFEIYGMTLPNNNIMNLVVMVIWKLLLF